MKSRNKQKSGKKVLYRKKGMKPLKKYTRRFV